MNKVRISAILLFLLLTVSLIFSSCSPLENDTEETAAETTVRQMSAESKAEASEDSVYPMKSTLTENQMLIYDEITAALNEYSYSISISNEKNADEITTAYLAVAHDHPEYFIGVSHKITGTGSGSMLTAAHYDGTVKYEEARNLVDREVAIIAAQAELLPDKFSRVKFVYDYIIDNTEYDTELAERGMATSDSEIINPLKSGETAYGCLIEHKAVCSGYSYAFQMVLQKLGIRCGSVTGLSNDEGHQWNFVRMDDGEYYYVDVTNGDSATSVKNDVIGNGRRLYEYLLINSNDLSARKLYDEYLKFPVCNGTAYNYHRMVGRYYDSYDFDVLNEAARNNQEQVFSIRYSNKEAYDVAENALFDRSHALRLELGADSIIYSVNRTLMVINIFPVYN